ncbi:ATP-grasp fold amidoligase family protein [Parabacteroides sp. ZJ-118]|uniref:ATP-grasp fold amidoligase family protein n=1 Tax=Parabacteroides sp. ZJ-118 TaxID=2709398 RepID=UPI0013EBAB22|nr:ATP-grasp fold amidoligase family protein [Parabacteroides sp. ZJ-118]
MCDYKFFCFGGKVGVVYGISGRNLGTGAQVGIYSRDFVKLDVVRNDEIAQEQPLSKPLNYERMVEIAENIGRYFPHVRVDLYNVVGRIYFGELTFYDGSGYMAFTPDSYDEELGRCFNIDWMHENSYTRQ